jgi:hypothetical protein
MRGRLVSLSRGVAGIIALAVFTGCAGSSGGPSSGGSGSCALGALLDGRSYVADGGYRVIPTRGQPLGTATVPGCEGDDGYDFQAVAIEGISPEVAFVDPGREDIVFIAEDVESRPPELMRLRLERGCGEEDAPIHLVGPWLGIIGPHGETEVDLVPPYVLEMLVEDASIARYEGAFLNIHVAADRGTPLDRQDVRSSLWEGGTLAVSATCVEGRYRAEHVTAAPPA